MNQENRTNIGKIKNGELILIPKENHYIIKTELITDLGKKADISSKERYRAMLLTIWKSMPEPVNLILI